MSKHVPKKDINRFVDAWRNKTLSEKEENRRLREKAMKEARVLSRMLGEEFGASRVILFGSLLDPDRFDEDSDIDLAVEGLPPATFFSAFGRLMMESSFEVDLKPYEVLTVGVKKRVSQGKVLYEYEKEKSDF